MIFKDRLSQLRKEFGLTQIEFAEKIGFSRTAVSAWEIGRNEPSNEDTIKIADFFNVSVDYLIGKSNYRNGYDLGFHQTLYLEIQNHYRNEISKLKLSPEENNIFNLIVSSFPINTVKDHVEESEIIEYIKSNYHHNLKDISEERQDIIFKRVLLFIAYTLDMKEYTDTAFKVNPIDNNVFPLPDTPIKIPIVGKISAGLPILAEENREGFGFAPSSMIKQGYTYFYLRVQGDSMNLKFNDGDIVLVQQQDYLENDEIGVILVNGFDATVKKYKNENGLVVLYPMSTNPEHSVQIYNPKEIDIKIVGKVISYQGKI